MFSDRIEIFTVKYNKEENAYTTKFCFHLHSYKERNLIFYKIKDGKFEMTDHHLSFLYFESDSKTIAVHEKESLVQKRRLLQYLKRVEKLKDANPEHFSVWRKKENRGDTTFSFGYKGEQYDLHFYSLDGENHVYLTAFDENLTQNIPFRGDSVDRIVDYFMKKSSYRLQLLRYFISKKAE